MAGVEIVPALAVQIAIETGQHDHAVRQPRDDTEQFAGRRNRTRRTGGDDHAFRRMRREPFCQGIERRVTPRRRIDGAFGRQQRGPLGAKKLEEIQNLRPMFGQRLGRKIAEPRHIRVLRLQLVHQTREALRQRARLHEAQRCAAPDLVPAPDKGREQQLPPHRRDRGDEIELAGIAIEQELILVDIAERPEIRQQRSTTQHARKHIGEAAGRAPRGEIDRDR